MKQLFINLFLRKKEVNSKPFRREIYQFFYEEYNSAIISAFTEVKVFRQKDKYIVRITTHYPGLLIGRQGRTINDLKDWLNKGEFLMPVEIELLESKMWHNLYR